MSTSHIKDIITVKYINCLLLKLLKLTWILNPTAANGNKKPRVWSWVLPDDQLLIFKELWTNWIIMKWAWVLLCHYLGDKACLQKDIGTSWILVEGVELATVDTQLTWPGIILLKSVHRNIEPANMCVEHEGQKDLQYWPNCSHSWTQKPRGTCMGIIVLRGTRLLYHSTSNSMEHLGFVAAVSHCQVCAP